MNSIYYLKSLSSLLDSCLASRSRQISLKTKPIALPTTNVFTSNSNSTLNLTSSLILNSRLAPAFLQLGVNPSIVIFVECYELDHNISLTNANYHLSSFHLLVKTNFEQIMNSYNLDINSAKLFSHYRHYFSAKNLIAVSLLASSLGVVNGAFATTSITGTHGQSGSVISGEITATTSGLTTNFKQTTDKAIINWNSFDINKDETVNFAQNSQFSVVLNRVTGGKISEILGKLNANGQVFIVNPNGIVFGKNSHVDVASLIASSLNITDDNFNNDNYIFDKSGNQVASVTNSGVILANASGIQKIMLIGDHVANKGVLESHNGTVFLLAGNSVILSYYNSSTGNKNYKTYTSIKVTAGSKAINLGKILSSSVLMMGNKVLNGAPSKDTAGIFADVIGSDSVNADAATITASNDIFLFASSESDQMQSYMQTEAQVSGKRNSLVENNGTLKTFRDNTTQNLPNSKGSVGILGDYLHLGNKSKIILKKNTVNAPDYPRGFGNLYLGAGDLGKPTHKQALQTIISKGSLVDISTDYDKPTASPKDSGSRISLYGKQLVVDGSFNMTTPIDNSVMFAIGKQVAIGKDFKVETNYQASPYLGFKSENFAIVGSDQDFTNRVNHQLVSGQNTFSDGSDIAQTNADSVFVNALNAISLRPNYITNDQIGSFGVNNITVMARNIVLYNVSNAFNDMKAFNLIAFHSGVSDLAITNTTIKNNGVFNIIGDDGLVSTANYVHLTNSNIQVNTFNNSNAYQTKLDNSQIVANQLSSIYNTNAITVDRLTDFNFNDSIELTNHSLIQSLAPASGLDNTLDLRANHFTVNNSEVLAQGSIEISPSFFSKLAYIKIADSNLTSTQGLVTLDANVANISLTNSNISAVVTYIDANPSYDASLASMDLQQPIGMISLNTVNVTVPSTVTSSTLGQITIGKNTYTNVQASGLKLTGNSINVTAQALTLGKANIKAKLGNVEITVVKDASISQSNFSGPGKVTVKSSTGSLTSEQVNFNNDQLVNLQAEQNLSLSVTSLKPNNFQLTTSNGNLTLANHTDLEVNNNDLIFNIAHGSLTVSNSKLSATGSGNLELTANHDLTLKDHAQLLAQGANGVTLTANHNVSFTHGSVQATTGKVNLTALGSYYLINDEFVAPQYITVLGHNNSLVDASSFQSGQGVTLSTELGSGVLYFGRNKFNGEKPINVNADTTNPVVCMYGEDTAYDYTSYHHHGGLCIGTGNIVKVVTQDVNDNINNDPNHIYLTNNLGDINLIKPLATITKDNLDISRNCRPKFILLMNKYHIRINDVRYGTEQALIYKYKVTSEQAEFLFSCYSRNIGYFNSLYSDDNNDMNKV